MRIVRSLYVFVVTLVVCLTGPVNAQSVGYQVALMEQLKGDSAAIEFYKERKFKPVWVGNNRNKQRAQEFIKAAQDGVVHALPVSQYDPDNLAKLLRSARSEELQGAVEGYFTRVFLDYATDLQSGILVPNKAVNDIKRSNPLRSRKSYLTSLAKSSPRAYFKALAPQSAEYKRLMQAKQTLLNVYAKGGWATNLPVTKLEPGMSNKAVVALRNTLIERGYLKRTNTTVYDANIQKAVQLFQLDHGLSTDGIAGPGTISELNVPVQNRLASIVVAMERERWMNLPLGKRHILVNLADYHAKIIDNGKVTFQTRSVIGTNKDDQRSPEFSDEMTHMVINPTWNVPRSITVKEYLPMLQRDPNAVGHLNMYNASGQKVSRAGVDFTAFNEKTFPFDLKQDPSNRNALGLVKFMFPNKYNIYLHDTPSKSLFNKETRAFSHGCIRLQQPFEFAYELLSKQSNDPQGQFHSILDTGKETTVMMKNPVPVHLIYRTAVGKPDGTVGFRRDIYGRDAAIFQALRREGVVIGGVQG